MHGSFVEIYVDGEQVLAEPDTAAMSVWVNATWFVRRGYHVEVDEGVVVAANGSKMDVHGRGRLTFTLFGVLFRNFPVRILEGMESKVLIGLRFIKSFGMNLDYFQDTASLYLRGQRYEGKLHTRVSQLYDSDTACADVEEKVASVGEKDIDQRIKELDLSQFSSDKALQEELRGILWENREIFKGVGSIKGIKHKIELIEGAKPVFLPMRRRSPAELEAEKREVTKLLDMGVLEPSNSPWGTLNVFVPKKDKTTLRTTSDFRQLNSLTVTDVYPMEDMKATIDWLSSKKFYSVFDLKDGFYQVELDEESRPLTAIRTCIGLFQYKRLPQGLKNSPATFQRIVNNILGDLKGQNVWCYMDDASVGSMTPEEHLKDLRIVLKRLRESGAKLKFSKCTWGTKEATVLGHKVTEYGILPSDEHTKAIRELKEPANGTELLRFLGVMNFFGSFIQDFANRAKPLYEVLEGSGFNKKKPKKRPVKIVDFDKKWGPAQREAWKDLKKDLSDPQFLVSPREGAKRKVMSDASSYGLGAVLLQEEGDHWRPIGFASKKLKGAEINYTTTEKECMAVVFALHKFRHHLQGGPTFEVVTDHHALKWLLSLKDPRGRLARWMMNIQDFDFKVIYAPGKELVVPDILSRDTFPLPLCSRCKGTLDDVEELKQLSETRNETLPTRDEFLEAQKEEFGDFSMYLDTEPVEGYTFILNDEGLLAVMRKDEMKIAVPSSLKERVLSWAHGSKVIGHYGVRRTLLKIRDRFWWPFMRRDVSKKIAECLSCDVIKAPRPRRQGRMQKYHPSRRWQIVAVDVLTISPESEEGHKKVLVIGDCFTRYMVAAPMKDETASTIAANLLSEWILRFGPPENLLSNRGTAFVGNVLDELCKILGMNKILCSPYHPQTDGMVERYNRTLCNDLAQYVSVHEQDWHKHVLMACYRYNTTVHEATSMTPFKAMYGVEAFELDHELALQDRIDEDPGVGEDLAKRLAELHRQLIGNGTRARDKAERYYNRAVKEGTYEEGERVLVYDPSSDLKKGRKLSAPWIGPYRVEQKLSDISYILKSEVGNMTARVHVNRLRRFSPDLEETGEPIGGVFPDTRRILRSIIDTEDREEGRYFKVRAARRSGAKWVKESDLPEIVVKAYDKIRLAKTQVPKVGMKVRIYWPLDKMFYSGKVVGYDPSTRKFKILYDDDDMVEHLDMSKEDWEQE